MQCSNSLNMYSIKSTFYLALIALSFCSCGDQPGQQEKKAWTATQKKVFKDNCFTSTRFSFEQMGKPLDATRINMICDCTALELESQYNYEATKRIPKAKVQEILRIALEKCAPDLTGTPTTDSVVPKR